MEFKIIQALLFLGCIYTNNFWPFVLFYTIETIKNCFNSHFSNANDEIKNEIDLLKSDLNALKLQNGIEKIK